MTWADDLQQGIAEYLHTQGVVDWALNVPITSLTRPLVIGPVPPAPDLCMGLVLFGGTPDPSQSEIVQPAQFWVRATDRGDAIDWCGELLDALHGAEGLTFGGIPCPLVLCRKTAIPMPRDALGRWEFANHFDFQASRPNAFRPE